MIGKLGNKDAKDARTVAIALIVLFVLLAIGLAFALPMLADFNQVHLAPGLGIKDAALIAFIATLVVLVIFALAAGDGLIGELQFMIPGFFAFYLVLWFLIAWVF